ncbi:MAG: replication initiator protein [Microviridae sp.]|nr:MAG: replication initiator protein [Microviridae sp.]
MTCYYPTVAWQSFSRNSSGKSEILFKSPSGDGFKEIRLPCSRCIGCRLERSRQWAIRCMHEASLWPSNCFITLTYAPEHLPIDVSLDVDHFQRFMKRLRKRFETYDIKTRKLNPIRFYHCGEYGEQGGRPHYHACLFNVDFPDKTLWMRSNGNNVYRSAILESLWPYGFSSIGSLTFQSAGYVARYIMKKQLGKNADEHYFDPYTGVIKRPEYTTMSRRPGIAAHWVEKYSTDVYPRDFVLANGRKMPPPRYYDKLVEKFNPNLWASVFEQRDIIRSSPLDNPNQPSLESKRLNAEARLKQLKRSI